MNKNSIKILCDQTDCIYNKVGANLKTMRDENVCSHLHPAIQRYGKHPTFDGLICNSKERDMTDPNKKFHSLPEPTICALCVDKDCSHCINIPPKPVIECGTPFDEEGTKGCSTCDPNRKSFDEYAG
jgi:hypothetical protein